MWGFAHLVKRGGARFVTPAPQKGKGVENRHNVALVFEKSRRQRASVRAADPSSAAISSIGSHRDFVAPKWSLANFHALE
jgi:hypothetical protein